MAMKLITKSGITLNAGIISKTAIFRSTAEIKTKSHSTKKPGNFEILKVL